MTAWLMAAGGLALLMAGGDALVRGAVAAAIRLGLSRLLVGLTVVGLGTSAPELATNLEAVIVGSPDIAIGNIVGSNISNVLLILGVAALIRPMLCAREAIRRDGMVLLAATAALVAATLAGEISRLVGVAFLAALGAYLVLTYRIERNRKSASANMHRAEAEAIPALVGPLWRAGLLCVLGLAGLIAGATLLIDGAVVIARAAGISEVVIGLTLVAIGTSLPELTISVIAAIKGEADVAFGNIIGSNLFNILAILGLTATIAPLPVAAQVAAFDVWAMAGATALMLWFAFTGHRLVRWEGAVGLALFVAYIWIQFDPGARAAVGIA